MLTHLTSIEKPQPAAIGLFTIDGANRHLGLFGDNPNYLTLIHAYAPVRKVVEHRFDDQWQQKLHAIFKWQNNNE